jgi:serine/threonine protein kinase
MTPLDHAGHAVFHNIVPGQVLAGKYRALHLLGKGGMGLVVAAEHIDLHERVALKLMLPDALESDEAITRFLREARAAVKIKGEHVARVLDAGHLETGEPYIAMEYLEGTPLEELLNENGPLPIKDAVDYLLQACEALAEAHALGIIHRDLKPANLFLTRRPDGSALVKVLDFGISRIMPRRISLEPVELSLTKTRQLLGTPLYMAPEQLVSRIHRMIEGAGLSSTLPQDLGPPEPTNAMPGTRRSLAHTWARIPRWPAAAGLVVLVMVLAGLSSFLQHSADPKASAPAQPRESKARPPASASAAPGDWQAVARPGSDWKSR